MLFNSFTFLLLFLPVTVLAFDFFNRKYGTNSALLILTLASLGFYSWWSVSNLPLLLFSILINYFISVKLSGRLRRFWFAIGCIFNIALLSYFKYAVFIFSNLLPTVPDFLHFPAELPLAISFFTFQQISYLYGVYAGADRYPPFISYVAFVSFFPHLIAGPILSHKETGKQFAVFPRSVPAALRLGGLTLLGIGLFKKVIIADSISPYADRLFNGLDVGRQLAPLDAVSAPFLYGFQLYFDFSGYCDMATGIAMLFGIKFPINFDSPYRAVSIGDFWRRWHITLSSFLRDFLYVPLGGNRRGFVRMLIALLITMLLGGFWHGAAWTFAVWGSIHGGFLIIQRLFQRTGIRLNNALSSLITLCCVMLAWVFFRATSLDSAFMLYAAMLPTHTSSVLISSETATHWTIVAMAWLICVLLPNAFSKAQEISLLQSDDFVDRKMLTYITSAAVMMLCSALMIGKISPFLYFTF